MKPLTLARCLLLFCAFFCLVMFALLYASNLSPATAAETFLSDLQARPWYAIGFGVAPLALSLIAITAFLFARDAEHRARSSVACIVGLLIAVAVATWQYVGRGSLSPVIPAAALFLLSWHFIRQESKRY